MWGSNPHLAIIKSVVYWLKKEVLSISKGMSLDMYTFIKRNMHRIPRIDVENGEITTVKGTNGSICTSTGYRRVKVNGRLLQVHQILAVVLFGEECVGMQVNHLDGNKLNNKRANLEICTQIENIEHAIKNGIMINKSERMLQINRKKRKLTDDDVRFIRKNYSRNKKSNSDEQGYNLKELGEMFNMNETTIADIVNFVLYRDVD